MQSLNVNGRCAVIVPDGVLFNENKQFRETRKHLCEKFKLIKVISLEDGLFLNTGVKSSILFFKNVSVTDKVEFCNAKLENDEIMEDIIIDIDITEIRKNNYNLSINKYNCEEEIKIEGLEYKKIGDVCEFKNGSQLDKKNIQNGNIPVFGGGVKQVGYHNQHNRNGNETIICGTGAYAGYINYNYGIPFWASQCFTMQSKYNNLNNKFLYYYSKLKLEKKIMSKQKGSAIPFIRSNQIMDLIIPIPKLEIQNKIVEILDLYYNIIKNNNKNIKNYEETKKNIVYAYTIYTEKQKLGDICNINQGTMLTKIKMMNGIYDVIGGGKIIGKHNITNRNGNEIILTRVGEININFIDKPYYLTDNGFSIISKHDNIFTKYIYYLLILNKNNLRNLYNGSVQKVISKVNLLNYKIPVPSLEIQNKIVQECEYYDNMINILKSENEKLHNNNIIEMFLNNNQLIEFDNDNISLNTNQSEQEQEQEQEQESEQESEQEQEQEQLNDSI
jgi:type I restriction enzyme S subunit